MQVELKESCATLPVLYAFYFEAQSQFLCSPGWPWTHDPCPASTFRVSEKTDMHHYTWLIVCLCVSECLLCTFQQISHVWCSIINHSHYDAHCIAWTHSSYTWKLALSYFALTSPPPMIPANHHCSLIWEDVFLLTVLGIEPRTFLLSYKTSYFMFLRQVLIKSLN